MYFGCANTPSIQMPASWMQMMKKVIEVASWKDGSIFSGVAIYIYNYMPKRYIYIYIQSLKDENQATNITGTPPCRTGVLFPKPAGKATVHPYLMVKTMGSYRAQGNRVIGQYWRL